VYVPACSVTSPLRLVLPKLPGATLPLICWPAVVEQLKLGKVGSVVTIGKDEIGFGPELRITGALPPVRWFVYTSQKLQFDCAEMLSALICEPSSSIIAGLPLPPPPQMSIWPPASFTPTSPW
jgi:hypothetical protein